ncbi:myb-like protein X [Zerene cesonia]|uniref:myb-like protein X n=1 Tax=Zerene cesonia TaxID=33412 RepID=UPI0018E5755D|nr:myb-like protein X [Zerene cesonia]
MHITTVILVLQCTICLAIRVPVNWDESEVKEALKLEDKPVPNEYFQYTANKPQFAVDVAKFHDVKSPEKHYESYPVQPHTGLTKPAFGKHQMLNSENQNYKPYQQYVQQDNNRQVSPVSNYYEVFHPYKAEIPALQEIYKDPVLNKIRNDVRDSKNRLQQYEQDAGEPNVEKDEYLESPEITDRKRFPIRNKPVRYEVHRPQRKPIYYQPIPITNHREHYLNQKLKHPWNQNYAKVTPMHYRPLKHHLNRLRQQHALTYDDERNEYPQITPPEQYAEKPDGYDIYEKGKDNYNKIRNNFDESINKAIIKNRPVANQNLEFQEENKAQDEEETFVPIKNYAQVRKTETFKHLPKSAAFRDAQNLEEYQNAPRLREAIKSSKNQVVYSEEGYEDSAYDHGGEQKHASDHEGHGGFLKEKESSKGKYKIPTIDIGFADEGKTASRQQVLHGEKWNDEKVDSQDENDTEDYTEDENDYNEKTDDEDITSAEYNERNKRDDNNTQTNLKDSTENRDENLESVLEHEVAKREIKLNMSEPKLKLRLPETKETNRKILFEKYKNKLKKKYPYYFKNSKILNKNSPLRYAENIKLIPQKMSSDTAFYNSRIALECPEVETEINPVPEKFENDDVTSSNDDGDNDEDEDEKDSDKGEEEFKNFKNKQRLKGLGDKIDCLKAKYFGEDPLDSPFFKEETINNPLPPSKPNNKIFILPNGNLQQRTKNTLNNFTESNPDILSLLNKLYDNNTFKNNKTENISDQNDSKEYNHHINKESVTKMPHILRKKRSATFMYEPYKVIKESQSQDSKKLTGNGNVSPLIKKLQTRQIIERASSNNQKQYKDIGKNDRPANAQETKFVDVSVDQRRGEPRYELDRGNHKSVYSPVENRSSISVDEYKKKISNENYSNKHMDDTINKEITNKPYFDVSKYLPQTLMTQNLAASNKIEKVVPSTTPTPRADIDENDEDDDYEEYDEEDDEDDLTTTTTTKKPAKIRIRLTTTIKPDVTEQPETSKLRLVTRFHTTSTTEKPFEKINDQKFNNRDDNVRSPKYREKKKKSTKSTLVTDTERYGDDDDDMREKEIDAMIGVQHDMDEYIPMYEKEEKRKLSSTQNEKDAENDSDENEHGGHSENDEDDDDDDDDDDNDDDDDDDDDDDVDVEENNDHRKDEHHIGKEKISAPNERVKMETTTSEPTKRTLLRTTEPTATTEVLNKMNEQRPMIFRKRVEIHKELPVDEKSPHVTHFKQDIKEVEVVKEMEEPKKKKIKNSEALELYKDDNLAKDINQLGGVEIFRDDIDLETGPRHGGNYRSIKPEELRQENLGSNVDVEGSQSETKSTIQVEPTTARPRIKSDVIRSRNVRNRNAKLNDRSGAKAETSTISTRQENLRKLRRNRNENEKSAKLIEFQDEDAENHPRNMHGGNFKTYNTRSNNRPMHGGNYRSAKIVQADIVKTTPSITSTTTGRTIPIRNRKQEAELLNTFARVVPELTTPPAFILDPSKRQYYYVD